MYENIEFFRLVPRFFKGETKTPGLLQHRGYGNLNNLFFQWKTVVFQQVRKLLNSGYISWGSHEHH
jgi:hypothetical protein